MLGFLKKLSGKSSPDYKELVKDGALIIDVRTVEEYRSGHISGSKNYPLDQIRNQVQAIKKLNKPVITVCRSGARSGVARNILKSAGVEVYNGGAWTSLNTKIA